MPTKISPNTTKTNTILEEEDTSLGNLVDILLKVSKIDNPHERERLLKEYAEKITARELLHLPTDQFGRVKIHEYTSWEKEAHTRLTEALVHFMHIVLKNRQHIKDTSSKIQSSTINPFLDSIYPHKEYKIIFQFIVKYVTI